MKTQIEKLKKKYPHHNVKYEPQKSCKRCNGTGEHLNGFREMTLCICTCVGLPDIGGLLSDFVSKELNKGE